MLISSQETAAVNPEMKTFMTVALAFFMAYIGLMVGAAKGEFLDLSALGGFFSDKNAVKRDYKVLDTSVIIDGRIADVAETGFLGGTLIIPQFILTELQAGCRFARFVETPARTARTRYAATPSQQQQH